jgi:hypothetical protein
LLRIETLLPNGFDFQPLLESGFLNYNHQANKSAAAIIGEPTVARVINDGKDFYIEGFLYPESDEAKAVYKLAKTLEKNSKNRRLGFSIEGQAIERDPFNTKRITRARITGVAITACPKNPNTLLSIMKGEYSEPFVEEVEKSEESKTCSKCDHPQVNPESGICLNCGHTEKAMSAEGLSGITDVPDVEKVPKSLISNPPLKKSEIYTQIAKQYPRIALEKAKQIYSFIEQVNNQLFDMQNNPTQDAIDKSFAVLNQQMDLINKGEQAEELNAAPAAEASEVAPEAVAKSEDATPAAEAIVKSEDDEDGDMIKSMVNDMAQKRIDKGMNSDDAVNDMVSKGISLEIAQTAVQKIIAAAEALKAGQVSPGAAPASTSEAQAMSETSNAKIDGLIQTVGSFAKSEDVQAIGASVEALFKSQNEDLSRRFQALGSIYKSQVDENNELRKSLGEMQEGFRLMMDKLQRIESAPVGRKSMPTAAAVDRFAKSQDGTIQVSVSDKQQMKGLNDQLFGALDLIKSRGQNDALLERAIGEIEIAGGLDPRTVQQIAPRLKAMNIELIP